MPRRGAASSSSVGYLANHLAVEHSVVPSEELPWAPQLTLARSYTDEVLPVHPLLVLQPSSR